MVTRVVERGEGSVPTCLHIRRARGRSLCYTALEIIHVFQEDIRNRRGDFGVEAEVDCKGSLPVHTITSVDDRDGLAGGGGGGGRVASPSDESCQEDVQLQASGMDEEVAVLSPPVFKLLT